MKIFKNLFNFVLFIQVGLFFVFIVENIYTLNAIELDFEFGGLLPDIIDTDYHITVNFYAIVGAILGIVAIIVIASFSIVDTGINDTGTKIVSKYVYFIAMFAILSIGTLNYVLSIGYLGLIIELIFAIVWFLHGMQIMNIDSDDGD